MVTCSAPAQDLQDTDDDVWVSIEEYERVQRLAGRYWQTREDLKEEYEARLERMRDHMETYKYQFEEAEEMYKCQLGEEKERVKGLEEALEMAKREKEDTEMGDTGSQSEVKDKWR
jgi:hypothetical protein